MAKISIGIEHKPNQFTSMFFKTFAKYTHCTKVGKHQYTLIEQSSTYSIKAVSRLRLLLDALPIH